MDFEEVIKKRRSIRKYQDKEVPNELVEKIIGAGRTAPSGMNQQPWHFIVVKDKKVKKKFRELYDKAREERGAYKQDTSFVEKATIIFVLDKKEENCAPVLSTALAVENMLLEATNLGLGSLIMTAPLWRKKNIDEYRKALNVPENYEFHCVVLIGYADEEPKPKEKKSLKEIMGYERFGGK